METNFLDEESLPTGFITIDKIREFTPKQIQEGALLNIIGTVKDQQAPMLTKGSDAKYTIEILDSTVPMEKYGLKVNIFWPLHKMPKDVRCADIVVIRKIKAQDFAGNISLIANFATEFHFLSSKLVPDSPQALKSAKWSTYPPNVKVAPNLAETRYASWLHGRSADLDLPSETEFETRTIQSVQHKDKFKLLKDVKCESSKFVFANLIGEVVKVHDAGYDHVSVYFTDYTSNPNFYNYVWGRGFNNPDEIQDDYGYLQVGRSKAKKPDWQGPFGTLTIQLTAYDMQATYIRDKVKTKQWLLLTNVQIKYGRNGGLLEGFVRDREKIVVKILDTSLEAPSIGTETTEGRLQEALKRKLTWTKKFQQQQKAIQQEEGTMGKRKHDDDVESEPKRLNSKQRRQRERAAAEKKVKEAELQKVKLKNLNQNVKCQFPDQGPVSIKEILKPIEVELNGEKYQSSFANVKYRANVRIVDYFPPRIEDFAVGFRSSEFDGLSDYSGEEESDADTRREIWHSGKGFSKDSWEWRFALQIEDATTDGKESKDRMWLMVDNLSAQMLLNLPDNATSLRNQPDFLKQVKEQMFKLWGDLEERKSATLPKSPPPAPSETQSTVSLLPTSSPVIRGREALPINDSGDENETSQGSARIQCGQRSQHSSLEERDANIISKISGAGTETKEIEVRNKGFTCCIKQYGVKVDEQDSRKANAGDGKRWQRVFGLFGTMID